MLKLFAVLSSTHFTLFWSLIILILQQSCFQICI